jgi:hypothetical protein
MFKKIKHKLEITSTIRTMTQFYVLRAENDSTFYRPLSYSLPKHSNSTMPQYLMDKMVKQ